jgi:hypothetical protein
LSPLQVPENDPGGGQDGERLDRVEVHEQSGQKDRVLPRGGQQQAQPRQDEQGQKGSELHVVLSSVGKLKKGKKERRARYKPGIAVVFRVGSKEPLRFLHYVLNF